MLSGFRNGTDGPLHESIKFTRNGKLPRKRRVVVVEGVTTGTTFNVHQDDLDTMLRAINERVFHVKDAITGELRAPYQPEANIFENRCGKIRDRMLEFVSPTPMWSYQELVAQYHGRRATVYEQARLKLTSRRVQRMDSLIRGFGKPEKTNVSAKPDAVQRVISPRNPVYNLAVGVWIRPFEHKIYSGIRKLWGEATIAKGLNAIDTASLIKRKFSSFKDPVAIGVDAKRFDQHCSVAALEFEHSVYNKHYNNPELKRLLRWQLDNQVTVKCANGRIRYKVYGGRMSGDMNTALGNCLLMCIMMKAYQEHLGVDFKLINNGDDCVIFCEREHESIIHGSIFDYFKSFGFELVTEPSVYVLEQVEFCQTRPVFNGVGYIMCRDPRISQSKDAISMTPFNNESYFRKWIHAVGDGGLALTAGIPVVQEYYLCLKRNGMKGEIKDFRFLEQGLFKYGKGINQSYRQITPASRYSFYLAFGILPDVQIAREQFLHTLILQYSYALDETGFTGLNHPTYFGNTYASH